VACCAGLGEHLQGGWHALGLYCCAPIMQKVTQDERTSWTSAPASRHSRAPRALSRPSNHLRRSARDVPGPSASGATLEHQFSIIVQSCDNGPVHAVELSLGSVVALEEACMRALCDPDYRNVRQFALR
jgi:hypothetical protein